MTGTSESAQPKDNMANLPPMGFGVYHHDKHGKDETVLRLEAKCPTLEDLMNYTRQMNEYTKDEWQAAGWKEGIDVYFDSQRSLAIDKARVSTGPIMYQNHAVCQDWYGERTIKIDFRTLGDLRQLFGGRRDYGNAGTTTMPYQMILSLRHLWLCQLPVAELPDWTAATTFGLVGLLSNLRKLETLEMPIQFLMTARRRFAVMGIQFRKAIGSIVMPFPRNTGFDVRLAWIVECRNCSMGLDVDIGHIKGIEHWERMVRRIGESPDPELRGLQRVPRQMRYRKQEGYRVDWQGRFQGMDVQISTGGPIFNPNRRRRESMDPADRYRAHRTPEDVYDLNKTKVVLGLGEEYAALVKDRTPGLSPTSSDTSFWTEISSCAAPPSDWETSPSSASTLARQPFPEPKIGTKEKRRQHNKCITWLTPRGGGVSNPDLASCETWAAIKRGRLQHDIHRRRDSLKLDETSEAFPLWREARNEVREMAARQRRTSEADCVRWILLLGSDQTAP